MLKRIGTIKIFLFKKNAHVCILHFRSPSVKEENNRNTFAFFKHNRGYVNAYYTGMDRYICCVILQVIGNLSEHRPRWGNASRLVSCIFIFIFFSGGHQPSNS